MSLKNTPRIVILGIRGRMGRSIVENALSSGRVSIVGGVDLKVGTITELGYAIDAPIVASLADAPECDVVIDFSSPSVTQSVSEIAAKRGFSMVVGTTGLEESHLMSLKDAGTHIAVVRSPNMSVGVNTLFDLVDRASRALDEDWDVEVSEVHHHHKVDAPSGTARHLLELISSARGVGEESHVHGREGIVGARTSGEIGMHTLRGGDVVGEHTVFYFGQGERIEINHRATDRGIFARGAIRAAIWAAGREAGFYSMSDVLKG